MTDSTKNEDETLSVKAKIRRRESAKSWTAPLWNFAGEVVAFMPTYRESREGRKKRNSIKLVIVVIGAGLLFAGGTADTAVALWLTLGALIMASALVVPIEELKKRTLRTKIRKKGQPRQKSVWVSGKVVCDGRKVEVRAGDERLNQVSIKRDKHEVVVRRRDGETCLGVLSMSRKVKDGVWVCTDDGVAAESEGSVDGDEMEYPARVTGSDWERLWNELNDES